MVSDQVISGGRGRTNGKRLRMTWHNDGHSLAPASRNVIHRSPSVSKNRRGERGQGLRGEARVHGGTVAVVGFRIPLRSDGTGQAERMIEAASFAERGPDGEEPAKVSNVSTIPDERASRLLLVELRVVHVDMVG